MDIDTILYHVRELANRARSAEESWVPVCHINEDGEEDYNVPDSGRQVLVFLNGHCGQGDMEARNGGGWGVRLGFYDHDKQAWRAGGLSEGQHVTHWKDLPPPPRRG